MHDLLVWYRSKAEEPDFNPIILAAEFHYRFIRIHPFDDGNGRTARILMNFILMLFGYPPVIIKTDDKINYFAALQQADAGIIQPFINYIATNLIRSLEIMIAGAKGESIEELDDIDKEIALLEQRLKASKNKIDVQRTKESILEIYDDTITRLWPEFIKNCQRFDNFYLQREAWFRARPNVSKDNLDNAVISLRKGIDEHITWVELQYKYVTFNQESSKNYDYSSTIVFDFHLSGGYIIRTTTKMITKKYGEQLSDQEIKDLLRAESKKHKEFIEERLKE